MAVSKEAVEKRISQIRNRIGVILKTEFTPELISEFKALVKEEAILYRNLNRLHVESLEDPAAVFNDACRLLPLAMDYTYVYFFQEIESGKIAAPGADEVIFLSLDYYPYIHRFSKSFRKTANRISSLNVTADNTPLIFEKESITRYVFEHVLKYHFEALEGLPEKKRLKVFADRYISDCAWIQSKEESGTMPFSLLDSGGSLPMYHSATFDEIARLTGKDFENSTGSSTFTYTGSNDLSITISDISSLKLNMSVRCHQLFTVALGLFTEQNLKLTKDNLLSDYTVRIPIDQYIKLLGYDIDYHQMPTQEEQAAEHKRVEHTKREAMRAIRKDLDTLHHSTIRIRTKGKGTFTYSLCQVTGIDGSYMYIKFGNDIIRYLATLPKTQYSLWLPQISGRQANTYRIGNKLVTHASMEKNQRYGTSDRLKVKSLLAVTDLPTLKDLKNAKHGKEGRDAARKWRARIKQPLETALDNLVNLESGGLISWHYALPGEADKEIDREEVNQIDNFADFTDLLVVFELANKPCFV